MTTLSAVVADARSRLAAAGLPDATIEARILIGGVLGLTATDVFVRGDREIGGPELEKIAEAIGRRLKREPVHRILGEREFHGMVLKLSPETLEPRPDTEILVDAILPYVRQFVASRGEVRILDLGTGTGAILLALLKECPQATGVGTDLSEAALQTARENAARLGLAGRFETIRSNWLEEVTGRFDIVVSNPPYIRTGVIAALEPEVREFDPLRALDGGPDGLDCYRAIAAGAGQVVAPSGMVGVEIGYDQRDSVTTIFQAVGFILHQALRDFGDKDRVLLFAKAEPDH